MIRTNLNSSMRFVRLVVVFVLCFCMTAGEVYLYAQTPSVENTSASSSQSAVSENNSVLIPESFGKIEESHINEKSNATIVFIQDAHASLEAQENISNIITHLVENKNVTQVFEEGFEGVVPSDEFFGFLSDPAIKQKLSYALMDLLRIRGAEYAHINRKKDFVLTGVDKRELYQENLDTYREAWKRQPRIEKGLNRIQAALQRLMDRFYSRETKEISKLIKRHRSNEILFLDYLDRMIKAADQEWVELNVHRFARINTILAAAKDETGKAADDVKMIDPLELLDEVRDFENAMLREHLVSERDQRIYEYLEDIELLRKLNKLEITLDEYNALQERLNKINTRVLVDFIAKHSGKSFLAVNRWEQDLKYAMKFYEIAKARDQNLEGYLQKIKEGKSDGGQLIPIVFGGFHKEGVLRLLKKHNFSYHLVMPKISTISEKHADYYKRLMTRGVHDYELSPIVQTALPQEGVFDRQVAHFFINVYVPHVLRNVPTGLTRSEVRTAIEDVRKNSIIRVEEGVSDDKFIAAYSYFKLGDAAAVRIAGEELAVKIAADLRERFVEEDTDDWVVVSVQGTLGLPMNSISAASQIVAESLQLPFVQIGPFYSYSAIRKLETVGYSALPLSERVKRKPIRRGIPTAVMEQLRGKKIIFLDDALNTGTLFKRLEDELLPNNEIIPYFFADIHAQAPPFEEHMNRRAFELYGLDPFVDILNDIEAVHSSKLLMLAFTLPEELFRFLISQLQNRSILTLYLNSLELLDKDSPNAWVLWERLHYIASENHLPDLETISQNRTDAFYGEARQILEDYQFHVPPSAIDIVAERLNAKVQRPSASENGKRDPRSEIRDAGQQSATIFTDLADVSLLTAEQLAQDFMRTAQLNRKTTFVFYNDTGQVRSEIRHQLEVMQTELGHQRVVITEQGAAQVFGRDWKGNWVHVSKGEIRAETLEVQRIASQRRRITQFRYLEDELQLVPVALVYANREGQARDGRVMDLGMVNPRLRAAITRYFAQFIFASAA